MNSSELIEKYEQDPNNVDIAPLSIEPEFFSRQSAIDIAEDLEDDRVHPASIRGAIRFVFYALDHPGCHESKIMRLCNLNQTHSILATKMFPELYEDDDGRLYVMLSERLTNGRKALEAEGRE